MRVSPSFGFERVIYRAARSERTVRCLCLALVISVLFPAFARGVIRMRSSASYIGTGRRGTGALVRTCWDFSNNSSVFRGSPRPAVLLRVLSPGASPGAHAARPPYMFRDRRASTRRYAPERLNPLMAAKPPSARRARPCVPVLVHHSSTDYRHRRYPLTDTPTRHQPYPQRGSCPAPHRA